MIEKITEIDDELWIPHLRCIIADFANDNNLTNDQLYKFLGVKMLEVCYILEFTEQEMMYLFRQMERTYMKIVELHKDD